ncbi:MAG: carbon-nitrogen hydrolase family protein [Campylobacterota bacterium]|nr:carbon-nitrogen hydrolase family protein [Campylobacterota bacterium]
MKIAALQLLYMGMSSTRLYKYVRNAHKQGVKLLLLGEYMLNPFFKELQSVTPAMIREQSDHQVAILKELSKEYNMTIVAPLIVIRKKEPYKCIVKIAPTSTAYYDQQLLINYKHWNEERFFSNMIKPLQSPLIFTIENIKFAVMGGFELHFDELWNYVSNKSVDVVLLPSIATFDSNERWKDLIKMRSFTKNCYVLRANRVGEYIEDEHSWKFYGNSLLTSPDGIIESELGDVEELMVVEVNHSEVVESRRAWGFREALNRRITT